MANFDINSRFNKKANFSQVVFGEDGVLLETELNEMQHIQEEARADIIRQSIPSGLLTPIIFDQSIEKVNLNSIAIVEELKANVNGYLLTIPKNTYIQLDEPPTGDFQSITGRVGERDDFVFLEVWKEEVSYENTVKEYGGDSTTPILNTIKDSRVDIETTRRIQIKWRIRVVTDVDFNKTWQSSGVIHPYIGWYSSDNRCNIMAQGGNSEPNNDTTAGTVDVYGFIGADRKSDYTTLNDNFLLISGKGDAISKSKLNTIDGFVYAIPLLKVKRRNSSHYSASNPNGAVQTVKVKNFPIIERSDGQSLTTPTLIVNSTAKIDIGCPLDKSFIGGFLRRTNTSSSFWAVEDIDGTIVTVRALISSGNLQLNNTDYIFITAERPDKLHSNTIDQEDIVPMYHSPSLTGFNYDSLLKENFEKLIKGELRTKEGEKLVKTYHGISKPPLDNNTIAYIDFSNGLVPQRGDIVLNRLSRIGSGCYGISGRPNNLSGSVNSAPSILIHNVFQFRNSFSLDIHIFIQSKLLRGSFIQVGFGQFDAIFRLRTEDVELGYNMIRFEIDNGDAISYVNGVVKPTYQFSKTVENSGLHITIGDGSDNSSTTSIRALIPKICLIRFSNVIRGNNAVDLPTDFVNGYAHIADTFDSQRLTYTDAIMTSHTCDVVKCIGETKPQLSVEKAGNTWAKGDMIKVRGLRGECISGILDTDTAFTTIVESAKQGDNQLTLHSVGELSVGDTFYILNPDMTSWSATLRTITAIDTVNNVITFDLGIGADLSGEMFLIENTGDSSSPTVRYVHNGVFEKAVGTWSGVGLNEATFILGDNLNLTTQDVEVHYSLNTSRGQGALREILTEVLEADYQGKKLKLNAPHVYDDFKGKVFGSYEANPNDFNFSISTELTDRGTQGYAQSDYNLINELNGTTKEMIRSNANEVPQQHFTFDLIRIIEDKFGEIQSVNKVNWLKTNVDFIDMIWHGYGGCPDGSYAHLAPYSIHLEKWLDGGFGATHTSNTVRMLHIPLGDGNYVGAQAPDVIDDMGKCHFVVYTKKSDGVTPSFVRTDYVEICIRLRNSLGDSLTAENPRRDAGKSPILIVDKQTKAVSRYPLGHNLPITGLVTYGKYIPYQGLGESLSDVKILAIGDFLLTSLGTGGVIGDIGVHKYYNLTGQVPMLQDTQYELTCDPVIDSDYRSAYYNFSVITTESLTELTQFYAHTNGEKTGLYSLIGQTTGFRIYGDQSLVMQGCNDFGNHAPFTNANSEDLFFVIEKYLNSKYNKHTNILVLLPFLVEKNGELYLVITSSYNKLTNSSCWDSYKLQNSPIIKEGL